MDIEKIKETYTNCSTEKLIYLLPDIGGMNPEVLPYLQEELNNRGKTEEAGLIADFIDGAELKPNVLTPEEVYKIVENRLKNGESIDTIKFDLKHQGVDILKMAQEEQQKEDSIFDLMTLLKDEGKTYKEIEKELAEKLGINDEETIVLNEKLAKKGKRNVTIGYILILIALTYGLVYYSYREWVSFKAIGILLIGVWRIQIGKKQQA